MAGKTVKITISFSTNPAVPGPFFADARDTTNGTNRQMTTRTGSAATLRDFINDAATAAQRAGVALTVEDDTSGEFTGRGGLINTPFSD